MFTEENRRFNIPLISILLLALVLRVTAIALQGSTFF
ncbi:hypothetical protein JOC69_000228 [Heliobacterium gestii]|nr:hypothetical protein [Heliomicrobium gestii]